MTGKILIFDERTGQGVIRFAGEIDFCFSGVDVEGLGILCKGDEVRFNVKQERGKELAFDVRLRGVR